MAALVTNDIAAVLLEKVLPVVDDMYEYEDSLFALFQKVPVNNQSTRSMRIPLKIRPGGDFGHANFNGGDLGRGSAPKFEVATIVPLEYKLGVEYTLQTQILSKSNETAIANVVAGLVADAMTEFKAHKDKQAQCAGDGVLAVVASVASNVFTLASPYYAQLLRHNQVVQVYPADLSAPRGSCRITTLNDTANTITVDTVPGGTTGTDLIVVDGLSGANPVGTYGLQYNANDSAARTWLGLSTATYPELVTPSVDAQGTLTPAHPLMLETKMEMLKGSRMFADGRWMWYMHPKNHTDWVLQMQQISNINLSADNGSIDLTFSRKKQRNISGYAVETSRNCSRTRIDFLNTQNWRRTTYQDTTILQMGGSKRLPIYGDSGGYGSAEIFYLVNAEQLFVLDPREGGFIKGITEPTYG